MKKIIALICCFCIGFYLAPKSDALAESSKAAVLINAETGEILFGKNENEIYPMASTTKIMTALLSLEAGNLDEKFEVDKNAIKVEGTSMGLKEGDRVTLYELCVGMLLASGNDAAGAAAVRVAGSTEAFLTLMNQKATALGLKNTSFKTPSGLDSEGHGSTAYDMALLGAAALKNEVFKSICSQKTAKVCFGQPEIVRTYYNHNKLLVMDEEIIGVKTGYTKKAGRCLVSAKETDGVTLVAVTLNDKDDWETHLSLFDYGFSLVKTDEYKEQRFSLPVAGGKKGTVALKVSAGRISYTGKEITSKVFLPEFVYAPIGEGEIVGEICFYSGGEKIESAPIITAEAVEQAEKLNWFQKLLRFLKKLFS